MDEFLAFVADILEVDVSAISPETRYGEVPEWDSLMHLRLIGEIEEHYDVELPLDDASDIQTLADFYALTRA
jgi:acyl carrier protein